MAFRLIQKVIGALAANGTEITVSYEDAIAEGNLLIAKISLRGNVEGPTWPAGWIVDVVEIDNTIIAVAHKIAVAGESLGITPDWNNPAGAALALSEWSLPEANPLDKTAVNSILNATSLSTGLTAQTVQAHELLIAAIAVRDDFGSWDEWTNEFVAQDDIVSTSPSVASLAWASRIVSFKGTYETTGSWLNVQHASGAIVTFKAIPDVTPVFGQVLINPAEGTDRPRYGQIISL